MRSMNCVKKEMMTFGVIDDLCQNREPEKKDSVTTTANWKKGRGVHQKHSMLMKIFYFFIKFKFN